MIEEKNARHVQVYLDWLQPGGVNILNAPVDPAVMTGFRASIARKEFVPTLGRAIEERDIPHLLALSLMEAAKGEVDPRGHLVSIVLEEPGQPVLLIERDGILAFYAEVAKTKEKSK